MEFKNQEKRYISKTTYLVHLAKEFQFKIHWVLHAFKIVLYTYGIKPEKSILFDI